MREAINEDFADVARAHLMREAISRNQHALGRSYRLGRWSTLIRQAINRNQHAPGRSYRLGSLEHLHVREDRRVVVAGDVELARAHPRGEHHTLRPRGLQLLGAHLMRESITEDEGGNQRR